MKRGDIVSTPDGRGVIIGVIIGVALPESHRVKRYIVKLDKPIHNFNPCYSPKDLVKIIGLRRPHEASHSNRLHIRRVNCFTSSDRPDLRAR
jgi:hypothetical protein